MIQKKSCLLITSLLHVGFFNTLQSSAPDTASNKGNISFELPPSIMQTNAQIQQALTQTQNAITQVSSTLNQVQTTVKDLPATMNTTMANTINTTIAQLPSHKQIVPYSAISIAFGGIGYTFARHGTLMAIKGTKLAIWSDTQTDEGKQKRKRAMKHALVGVGFLTLGVGLLYNTARIATFFTRNR
jgi:hypothetical protein